MVIGLWIRLGVTDAPEFLEHKESGNVPRQPLWEVVTRHPRVLLVTIGLRLAQNSVYYLITVYMLTYLADRRGDSTSGITAVMIASAIGLVTGPFWGWVSDRVGRKAVTLGGIIGIGVFGWIFFAFLENGPLILLPIIVVLGMNLAHDAVYGPQAAWFAEQFPIEVRYSGVNMGYQLGTVIGGGIMPMVAALLFVAGGSTPWLICAYLTLLCVLSGIAALAAHDPARAEALARRTAPAPDTHRPIQETSH